VAALNWDVKHDWAYVVGMHTCTSHYWHMLHPYCKLVGPMLWHLCQGSVCCGLCCKYRSDIVGRACGLQAKQKISRSVTRFRIC